MLAIKLERVERRIEAISDNPFIDPKDKDQLLREVRRDMQVTIQKYNDLELD